MRIKSGETNTQEVVALVNSFGQLKGWKLYRELIKWIFTGMFMGTSDAIPGYSGGTTLALLGFFKRLILIAKSVFIPEKGLTRMKALSFMLPFAAGWMGGIFGFAKLTEYMTDHGAGLELIFFFSAFIAFAIPIFLRSEDPMLRNKDKKQKHRWAFFLVGIIVVLGLALWIFISNKGVKFGGEHEEASKFHMNTEWWKLILVAFGAGAVTLIPGGSGAIIQLLTGYYPKIHWSIMAHPGEHFGGLVLFGFSTFLGMLMMVFAFSWILKHKEKELAALSFGMLIASTVAVFLVPHKDIWGDIHQLKHILGVSGALIGGASCALTIQYIVFRQDKATKFKLKSKK